jgi:hypothetical protein
MSGLLYLSNNDFKVTNGVNGPILCTNIKGLSLILYYSNQCKYCGTVISIFKKLPGSLMGCQFGIVNVSMSKEVVKASAKTNTPLEYVPFILLYVDGRPFMSYDGKHDITDIINFIKDAISKLQQQKKFSNANTVGDRIQSSTKAVPGYTTGHPLYGNRVCYLESDKCYK